MSELSCPACGHILFSLTGAAPVPGQSGSQGDGQQAQQQAQRLCQNKGCGTSIRGNYAVCYACNRYPDRTPGVCIQCGGNCSNAFAVCWVCSHPEEAAAQAAAGGSGVSQPQPVAQPVARPPDEDPFGPPPF